VDCGIWQYGRGRGVGGASTHTCTRAATRVATRAPTCVFNPHHHPYMSPTRASTHAPLSLPLVSPSSLLPMRLSRTLRLGARVAWVVVKARLGVWLGALVGERCELAPVIPR
jgi:hypothetical protein